MTGNRLLNIFGVCLLVIVLPWLNSCKTITSFVHDGRVVAKIGNHKLYASDLNAYIPDSASPEDSTRLALQYINSWASDMAFIDVAEKELSKSEKNVDKELEDYRRSLLKYRYEQKYVNQRLDTAVTDAQIEKYYEAHIETDKPEDQMEADSVASYSAFRYTDFGGKWIDLVRLSREFGTDYGTVFSMLKDGVVEIPDDNGNLNIAYIGSLKKAGETGPVEYYRERIKDIILSTRKQALLNGLERDLIENARNQENFIIY